MKSLITILCVVTCVACSEEIEIAEQEVNESINYSDAELEKMAYGCDTYLDDGNDEKIENQASDAYLEYVSEHIILSAQSSLKAHPISNGEGRVYVGVIKQETCNNYATIKIHYDCEDKKTRKESSGNIGAWSYDNSGNINMYFCRVPFEDFPVNVGNNGYALLRLDSRPLAFNNAANNRINKYTYILSVHMDAEDEHEATSLSIEYNGNTESPSIINSNVRNFVKVSKYGDLDFDLIYMGYYFAEKPKTNGYSFPKFGFEYSVFGYVNGGFNPTTGNKNPNNNFDNRGCIFSDDEDTHNGNKIILSRQNSNGEIEQICDINDPKARETYSKYNVKDIDFSRIIEYSKSGTKFYMTKVNTNDIYY